MKGVAPAVWLSIVIVVSSAWLAPASPEKTVRRSAQMMKEKLFIGDWIMEKSFAF
jgi:hypothetical protein